jgi:cobalt-zinc-cadmium efflux system outer membrane protein
MRDQRRNQAFRSFVIHIYVLTAALLAMAILFPADASAVTLEDALRLALENNPSIKAARTQVNQNRAQETTAGLRPNPVLSFDSQFVPIFNPSLFSTNTLDTLQQFDIGAGYLIERGGKRLRRLDAARDQTHVTEAQIADMERALKFNVAQQFVNALLAQSNLEFALVDLASFEKTVKINEDRFKSGDISKNDYLIIKVQLLQFHNDVNTARLAKVQALTNLRQLIGYDAVPRDYDVEGKLAYEPVTSGLDDLQALAFRERPDLRAALLGVKASESQVALAKANGKQDLNVSFNYSHVSQASTGSVFFNIPVPVFNRNQGEIARTRYAQTQAQLSSKAAEETVMTDVRNAFEGMKSSEEIVKLYESGYLKDSNDSREISEFAYRQGAVALLDFLDAERTYRTTQLAYRQSLANYMLELEQLRQAIGARTLP